MMRPRIDTNDLQFDIEPTQSNGRIIMLRTKDIEHTFLINDVKQVSRDHDTIIIKMNDSTNLVMSFSQSMMADVLYTSMQREFKAKFNPEVDSSSEDGYG